MGTIGRRGDLVLVLASGSPRRKELLESAGFRPLVVAPGPEEERGLGLGPEEMARCHALAKALAIASRGWPQDHILLGADTVVSFQGQTFGKPLSQAEALDMLRQLAGQSHKVTTSYALVSFKGDVLVERSVTTEVCFRDLEPYEMEWYVACGEAMDKAGAYGIQGKAAGFVERIVGSYTNVVGLPLSQVIQDLRSLGCSIEREHDG